MKKNILLVLLAFALSASAQQKTEVTEFNLAGPFKVTAPLKFDTVDVKGNKYDEKSQLASLALKAEPTTVFSGKVLPKIEGERSVGVLTFYMTNSDYLKGKLKVKGPKNYKLYIDGKESAGDLNLIPEHHTFAIRYLAEPKDTDSISVTFDTQKKVEYTLSKKHTYMFSDLNNGKRVRGMSLSADGSLVVVSYQTTAPGGKSQWAYELRETKTGKLLRMLSSSPRWMPQSIAYLVDEKEGDTRKLYKVNPLTGERTVFADNLPEGSFNISPKEDYLIMSNREEGPKEDPEIYEIVEMDDRQPGWRSRSYLSKFDIATGMTQRITFGSKGEWLMDISRDGTKLLIGTSRSRLEKRPTTVWDVVIMDAKTLKTDTLIKDGEFLAGANLSPDATKLIVQATPEAFNRIGCILPENVTPNMYEYELYLFDIATKQVKPMTKDFAPAVSDVEWSAADGKIYFTAEDRDYVRFYCMNPENGKIEQMPVAGDYVFRTSLASNAQMFAYLSYEAISPASAYVMNLKTKKQQQYFDGRTALGDAEIGTCQDWNYTNSKGDTVYGRFYLPKNFDPSKKYPMIVYYYGGCSPTPRTFESPYAPHFWNSLGYVAYILQPSGATGFGQEWSSRHVNTAGRGPAEDIIEGTRKFCEEHPYVDATKIGCMGASYGGFMTMYLQTQTDLFAAAVSHAGIANHTSYWGQGYWGYNYSEVSMANSYPWSHRELYVDRSPLFNADKIHTPLLLLHGDVDTNVPPIESLQMFTALKLLGRDVALVQVKGENHHVLDYNRRNKWVAAQMAWFQKWLKGDSTWWDAMFPKKHL